MEKHALGGTSKLERKKLVTLEDVAKAAGVGTMTASRAIKGNGYVARATREKILRVATELNYTTNVAARMLASGRTGTIAIIAGELDKMHHVRTIHLLESLVSESGYMVRRASSRKQLKELISATSSSAVDGVIVHGSHDLLEDAEFINVQRPQHYVFVDTFAHPNTDYVRCNLKDAVENALGLMLALGRQRIAYVGVSERVPVEPIEPVEDRLKTYVQMMQKAGRKIEFINALNSTNFALRVQAVRDYFQTHGCPDAILCLHDEIAMITYRALRDCGCRVPEDVLLVGCDGLPQMELFDPPLSVIAQPMEEMCATAWKFLQARIENPEIPLQQVTLNAQLIVRKSLAPVQVKG